MSTERDQKGIWIPIELWEDKNLTPLQIVLLAEIDSLDCGEGCWMSSEKLANRMKCKVGHIDNLICDLRKRGYLKTIKKTKTKRHLRTCFSRHEVNLTPNLKIRSHLISRLGHASSKMKLSKQSSSVATPQPRGSFNLEAKDWKSKCTIKFFNWATIKRRLTGKPNFPKWRKAITKLGVDKDDFKKLMFWYFKHYKDHQYMPEARSMISFCEKFDKIQSARERWMKKHGVEELPEQKVRHFANGDYEVAIPMYQNED